MNKPQKQENQIVEIMERNGGYATLGFLNEKLMFQHGKQKPRMHLLEELYKTKNYFLILNPDYGL